MKKKREISEPSLHRLKKKIQTEREATLGIVYTKISKTSYIHIHDVIQQLNKFRLYCQILYFCSTNENKVKTELLHASEQQTNIGVSSLMIHYFE